MRGKIKTHDPSAFDAFAAEYDSDFTRSTLGRLLRPRVWSKLGAHFSPGQHVLELACGTGEDAVWLAQQGVRVTATDGSAKMVRQAQAKAEEKDCSANLAVEQVSLQKIASGYFTETFDGVYSNFGGLNTIAEWRSLAKALAKIVWPGSKVILVPMGPLCPWEIAWYLAHGQPRVAFRRFAYEGAPAKIGQALIPIWYPTSRRLCADFAPWFRHLQTESLGLWLPPSYIDHFVNRWPNLFGKLNRFEQATAHFSGGWGDHYVIIFERKSRKT